MPAPVAQPEPSTPYTGLTFLQLQQLAADWFGAQTTELAASDLARLKALLNEGVQRMNEALPGLVTIRKKYSITTTADQASYVVPMGISHIHDPILLDGAQVYSISTIYANRSAVEGVDPETQMAVRMYSADWEVNDAADNLRPRAILTFRPAPSVNGTALLWGTGEDNALDEDDDVVRVPTAYTSTPVYHAVQPLLAGRGRKRDLDAAVSMWNRDMGLLAATKNRQRTRGETNQWPNFVRSGRGRRFPGTYKVVP